MKGFDIRIKLAIKNELGSLSPLFFHLSGRVQIELVFLPEMFAIIGQWNYLDLQFSFFFFFGLIYFNWRLITLKYCTGFCYTLTWISHRCSCVSLPEPRSYLPPHPILQGHPSAPALSAHPVSCIEPGLVIYFTYVDLEFLLWKGFSCKFNFFNKCNSIHIINLFLSEIWLIDHLKKSVHLHLTLRIYWHKVVFNIPLLHFLNL